MTYWQRFFSDPPLRAWAVGVLPAVALIIVVFAVSDSAVKWLGVVAAVVVMHAVAAAVWPSAWRQTRQRWRSQ